MLSEGGIDLFTDEENAKALASAAGADKTLVGYLRAHLNRLKAGDYFALLGYVEMNEPHEKTLEGHSDERTRQEARGDVSRIRPALFAFHWASVQGRPEQRRVPASNLRR